MATSAGKPNKRMVPVSVSAAASDNRDAAVASSSRITAVTSNERQADFEITGTMSVNLSADRSGRGSGRTYDVWVSWTDASGECHAELDEGAGAARFGGSEVGRPRRVALRRATVHVPLMQPILHA